MPAPSPVERLLSLRLNQRDGRRSPHKPLLVLLALGRLVRTGSSALPWAEAEPALADLLAEYGPPSRTGRAQSAAYPFTRLRSDGVWTLDREVEMDAVGPLREAPVTGRLDLDLEARLRDDPAALAEVVRALVAAHFPETVAADLLTQVGLDPTLLWAGAPVADLVERRRRDARWRLAVLQAWDEQCAFCGYDGRVGPAPVGIEAAHVRWFNHGGPDQPDNGLALCSLHHSLFDRGALGLTDGAVVVSGAYTARSEAGRRVYDLHGRVLRPRPGTALPAAVHVAWHAREVFRGSVLTA